MLTKLRKDESGVILIVILAILALLCLIGITLVTTTRIERDAAVSTASGAQARLACEAALQYVIRNMTNDVAGNNVDMMRDAYGAEPWFFSTGSSNLCKGGTASTVSGSTLTSSGVTFGSVGSFFLQPNVNNPQTFPIDTVGAGSLTCETVRGITVDDVASAGDEYRVLGAYMWQTGDTLEADCTGDGTPDAVWIDFDIGSTRYSARYAVYIEDLSGKLNANMVGNLAAGTDTTSAIHADGIGFDSFEMSLVRAIKGTAPSSEVDDQRTRDYAKAIVEGRVGGSGNTDGYGLGEALSDLMTDTIGNIDAATDMGDVYFCQVSGLSDMPFLGRAGLVLRDSVGPTDFVILDNGGGVIIVPDTGSAPDTGACSIQQVGIFDPLDDNSDTSWSPYDERDAMEIRENSPHASALEKAVVDQGHDVGNANNDGIGGADEDGYTDTIDNDGDGVIDNAAPDDTDEKYCLFEEWDMIRPHLTTYMPSAVQAANSACEGTTPGTYDALRRNINSATGAQLETLLINAGVANDVTLDQFVANILAWRDPDNTIDNNTYNNRYGIEPHPIINEIYWEDKDASLGPNVGDWYAVELYNPFNVEIKFENGAATGNKYELYISNAGAGTYITLDTHATSMGPNSHLTIRTNVGVAAVITAPVYTDASLVIHNATPTWESISMYHQATDTTKILVDRAVAAAGVYNSAKTPSASQSIKRGDPFVDTWSASAGENLGDANGGTRYYYLNIQNRDFATPGEIVKVFKCDSGWVDDTAGTDFRYTDNLTTAPNRSAVRLTDSEIAQAMDRSMVHGDAGTVDSSTANTLTDVRSWTTDAYAGCSVRILSGTGVGQERTVSSNTDTVLTVSVNWTTNPDGTSKYFVSPVDTRWHGRINVNTASRAALMALPCMGYFDVDIGGRIDNGWRLADCIIRGRNATTNGTVGYTGFEDLLDWLNNPSSSGSWDGSWDRASTDTYDNDGDNTVDAGDADEANGNVAYLASDNVDNDGDGYTDETDNDTTVAGAEEAIEYFLSSIANLITFRSDVFDVIIKSEVVDNDRGITVGKAQLRAVVDRSTVASGSGAKIISRRWE